MFEWVLGKRYWKYRIEKRYSWNKLEEERSRTRGKGTFRGCRSFWRKNPLQFYNVTSVLSTSLGIFKPYLATLLLGGKCFSYQRVVSEFLVCYQPLNLIACKLEFPWVRINWAGWIFEKTFSLSLFPSPHFCPYPLLFPFLFLPPFLPLTSLPLPLTHL